MIFVESVLRLTLDQLLAVLLPFALVSMALYFLQRAIVQALMRRFGVRGTILATGWIGTPVHELSHAGMCFPFAHKIVEMKLFRPDANDGTLGYVKHTYEKNRPWYHPWRVWQEIGNFFIGAAPLVGGALAIYLALRVVLPNGPRVAFRPVHDVLSIGEMSRAMGAILGDIFSRPNFSDGPTLIRSLLFFYLVLAIGTHLAPSPADLKGMLPGLAFLVGTLAVVNAVVLFAAASPQRTALQAARAVAATIAPVLALFILALFLNLLMWGLVHVLVPLARK